MKNIIVVCEGQSEQIFLRNLIEKNLNPSLVSFGCLKLQGQKEEQVPYAYRLDNALLNIIILNAQNDERVLSVIKDRYNYFNNKYDIIIGIRDMYSDSYPDKRVNEKENLKIKRNIKKEINSFDFLGKVRFFFMIMEFEAWLMSLKNTIKDYVLDKSGIEPTIPGELQNLFRPSNTFKSILGKNKIKYDKHYDDTQSIFSFFNQDDLTLVLKSREPKSFHLFLRYCYKNTKQYIID